MSTTDRKYREGDWVQVPGYFVRIKGRHALGYDVEYYAPSPGCANGHLDTEGAGGTQVNTELMNDPPQWGWCNVCEKYGYFHAGQPPARDETATVPGRTYQQGYESGRNSFRQELLELLTNAASVPTDYQAGHNAGRESMKQELVQTLEGLKCTLFATQEHQEGFETCKRRLTEQLDNDVPF